MRVDELSRQQLIELKQAYLTQLDDSGELEEVLGCDSLSYSDLVNADDIVSDTLVLEHYEGMEFSEDDFTCSEGEA